MNKTTKTQVQQFVRKEKNLLERKSREYISIQVPEGIYICIYIKKNLRMLAPIDMKTFKIIHML